MILISVLVHEKLDVVLDQIANFKKFAPRAFVVIHVARQMVETSPEVPEILRKLDGVWVNPDPFYTGFGMVLKCHVSNFLYAMKAGIDFTHFCLHSSNDLFVRAGVEEYIGRHNYGFFQIDLSTTKIGFDHWQLNFLRDPIYRRMMREAGSLPVKFGSQVEGTFYPRKDFDDFAKLFLLRGWKEIPWPVNYVHGRNRKMVLLAEKVQRTPLRRKYLGQFAYPKEELYFPNYFSTKCSHPAAPYCYMNWGVELRVTESDVSAIRSGQIPAGDYEQLFSVKRVNRDVNDPLRKMIAALD